MYEADLRPLKRSRWTGDQSFVTVVLIAVGVELFGLACGVALARAAATDR
jgi:hypothetical protein